MKRKRIFLILSILTVFTLAVACGGQEAEDAAPEEYLANTPLDDLVREVYEVLEEFDKDDDFRNEYAYYEAVLTYWNKYTESNKVRLIF